MEISFKEKIYFVIEFDQIADRALVSRGFQDSLRPEFTKLIRSIKMEKTDLERFKKYTGVSASISILSEQDYLQKISKKSD